MRRAAVPIAVSFSPPLASRWFYSIQQILNARYHDTYWVLKISRASAGLRDTYSLWDAEWNTCSIIAMLFSDSSYNDIILFLSSFYNTLLSEFLNALLYSYVFFFSLLVEDRVLEVFPILFFFLVWLFIELYFLSLYISFSEHSLFIKSSCAM